MKYEYPRMIALGLTPAKHRQAAERAVTGMELTSRLANTGAMSRSQQFALALDGLALASTLVPNEHVQRAGQVISHGAGCFRNWYAACEAIEQKNWIGGLFHIFVGAVEGKEAIRHLRGY